MAQEWTEGRLDELSGKVDRGFEKAEGEIGGLRLEMRTEFTALRTEMNDGFNGVKDGFNGVKEDFKGVNDGLERVNERIDSVQRTMMLGFITLTGGILAGFAAICTLIATTL